MIEFDQCGRESTASELLQGSYGNDSAKISRVCKIEGVWRV